MGGIAVESRGISTEVVSRGARVVLRLRHNRPIGGHA